MLNVIGRFAASECLMSRGVPQKIFCTDFVPEHLQDVRRDFPKADQIGRVVVFNILHNQLRLITFEALGAQRIYAKALVTHKEYDRKQWMKWA